MAPVNESIGFAFAEALRDVLAARGIAVAAADRARFVKLAQGRRLPPALSGLLPAGIAPGDLAPALEMLDEYGALLRAHGVEDAACAAATRAAGRQYRALLDRPVASAGQMAELHRHAAAVIEAALRPPGAA